MKVLSVFSVYVHSITSTEHNQESAPSTEEVDELKHKIEELEARLDHSVIPDLQCVCVHALVELFRSPCINSYKIWFSEGFDSL